MMNKPTLIAIGAVAILGLGGCGYLVVRNKNRDEDAARFVEELDKKLNPETRGLEGEDALRPDYQDHCPPSKLLDPAQAKSKAKNIHDAWGEYWWIDDNESQVYSALRSLSNKCQLAQVSDAYYEEFEITLIDDIKDRMSSGEVKAVMGIINQLKE